MGGICRGCFHDCAARAACANRPVEALPKPAEIRSGSDGDVENRASNRRHVRMCVGWILVAIRHLASLLKGTGCIAALAMQNRAAPCGLARLGGSSQMRGTASPSKPMATPSAAATGAMCTWRSEAPAQGSSRYGQATPGVCSRRSVPMTLPAGRKPRQEHASRTSGVAPRRAGMIGDWVGRQS
jgi:hypothetical protein